MDGLLLLLEEVMVHRNRKNMNYKSVSVYCCAIWEMEPIISLSSTKIRIQMVFKGILYFPILVVDQAEPLRFEESAQDLSPYCQDHSDLIDPSFSIQYCSNISVKSKTTS